MLRQSILKIPLKNNIFFNNKNFENRMNFDGCSKGNPGLAGAGAVIYYNNEEIWSGYVFVRENVTNNHAEYAGLILGLNQATKLEINSLLVKGDSQLIINHMIGTYKCKSPNLIELYENAKELEKNFHIIKYEHVLHLFSFKTPIYFFILEIFLMSYIIFSGKTPPLAPQ